MVMESQRAVWMCGRMLGNQNKIVQQHLGFAMLHHHQSDERQKERMERENSANRSKGNTKVPIIQEWLPEINYSNIKHI